MRSLQQRAETGPHKAHGLGKDDADRPCRLIGAGSVESAAVEKGQIARRAALEAATFNPGSPRQPNFGQLDRASVLACSMGSFHVGNSSVGGLTLPHRDDQA
jgi:hypothetical protein